MYRSTGLPRLQRRPVVTVYVRHAGTCPNEGKEFYRGCDCSKWLRYSLNGRQHRLTANTRSWGTAEAKAQELQQQLDGGKAPSPSQSASQPTIAAAVETFLQGKAGKN